MKISLFIQTITLCLLLQACGGGGGSGDGDDTISLSWIPPSTRSDGSFLELSSILGYRIYCGESTDDMQLIAEMDDGTITTISLNAPGNGTYYYSVSAYDIYDLESNKSNAIRK
jgi:hypothetical protein